MEFSEELRDEVCELFKEMHHYYDARYTPKVRWSKACNACSLKDICLPVLGKKKSVKDYIYRHIEEEK